MTGKANRAEAYRVRAEEVRMIAESMNDPEIKRKLQGVANEYDHMAGQVERLSLEGEQGKLPRSSG